GGRRAGAAAGAGAGGGAGGGAGPPQTPPPREPMEKNGMSHDRDLADQDIEEVAEELWTLGEQGSDRLEDLKATSQVAELDAALPNLPDRTLAPLSPDPVSLTPPGPPMAH